MSARRRQCATCGEYSSYSAKACSNPACGKEFVLANPKPKPQAGRVDCCTPNCPRAASICVSGVWRCGQCYDEQIRGGAVQEGAGFEVWRKAIDEERKRRDEQGKTL